MIRFHVVKGSRVLLGIALAVLVIALLAVLVFGSGDGGARQTGAAEAEAVSAFASSHILGTGIRLEPLRKPTATAQRILIYHTHTHEAYAQDAVNVYVETAAWRTEDETHNVVRVGAYLAELLTEYGYTVIHDTTDHELDQLSTAYSRSLQTLVSYDEPFSLYIDLHRDAYNENGSGDPFAVEINGRETARLMMLVGNGEGFRDKPDYERNFRFATLLTNRLNALAPGLCRNVMVKDGRYNQHMAGECILVEAGHNENTLAQALSAMPYLAEGIHGMLAVSE